MKEAGIKVTLSSEIYCCTILQNVNVRLYNYLLINTSNVNLILGCYKESFVGDSSIFSLVISSEC